MPSPKTTKDQVPYCIALYDFPGETEEDLSFVAGDRIELLERIGTDWLKGCVHGTTGMFPAAFVEILEDLTGMLGMLPVNSCVLILSTVGLRESDNDIL